MGVFEIQAPDGKVYEVEGATAEGAMQALQQHLGQAPAEAKPQTRQRRSAPAPEVPQPKPDPFGGEQDPMARARMSDDIALANMGLPSTPQGEAISAVENVPAAGRAAVRDSSVPVLGSLADEFAGMMEALQGGDYEHGRQRYQAMGRYFQEQNPEQAAIAETMGKVTGTVASVGLGGGSAPAAGRLISTLRGAGIGAASGATTAGVEAAGNAEPGERLDAFRNGVVDGALIGGAAGGVTNLAAAQLSRTARRVLNASRKRPTVANLKSAKNAAYKAIEEAGEEVSAQDVKAMVQQFETALDEADFVEGVGGRTDTWLRRLRKTAERDQPLTATRLDSIRSNLWKSYRAAPDEVELLDAIRAIDDAIDKNAASSELFAVAREANSRFRKVELMEAAIDKANREAAASGSGGNVANKIKQAFNGIISSEKRSRFFSEAELNAMRAVVEDDPSGELLRKVGKLSPNGNGLMQALNLGAIAVDPSMMAASAGAAISKAAADGRVNRGAEEVIDFVATGRTPVPTTTSIPNALSGAAGILATTDR